MVEVGAVKNKDVKKHNKQTHHQFIVITGAVSSPVPSEFGKYTFTLLLNFTVSARKDVNFSIKVSTYKMRLRSENLLRIKR